MRKLPRRDRIEIAVGEMRQCTESSRSTLITSQLPIGAWHEYLNDATVADALLDRLLNGAHRLELRGESMRKRSATLTKSEAKK